MPCISEDISVQETITNFLDHFDYENAVFLAECYFSFNSCDAALHLLGTAYYRSGKVSSAYILLHRYGAKSWKTKYLLARCCDDLDKWNETEELLQDFTRQSSTQLKSGDREMANVAPFALSLLAKIFYKTNRVMKARESWEKSLKLSPFMWSSFELLSKAERDHSKLDVSSVFDITKIPQRHVADPQSSKVSQAVAGTAKTPASVQRSDTPLLPALIETPDGGEETTAGVCEFDSATPSPIGLDFPAPPVAPNAPPKAPRKATLKKYVSAGEDEEKSGRVTRRQSSKSSLSVLSQNQSQWSPRRSIRLLHQNSVKENADTRGVRPGLRKPKTKKSLDCDINQLNEVNKDRSTPKILVPKLLDSKLKNPSLPPSQHTEQKSETAELLKILSQFGEARLVSIRYENEEALNLLEALPEAQQKTPVCGMAIAKSYFQAADYKKAVEMFESCHRAYAHYLDGIELYSTALWQLQEEIELSTLAQEMTEHFKDAPQTWCVVGNCFSLQKEHDSAIKYFQRATQLDPDFVYAYSLMGHEYFSIEDFDKATKAFRRAVCIDPMHFNGWYGLGLISYRNEQLPLASVYFRRALEINPKSSVLLCHLSVVEQALMRGEEALKLLDKALRLKEDPLCRYHKAQLLFSKNRLDEAVEELNTLKQMVPKEANVFFLLGKVYRKRGETHKALINFSRATELDPRGEQHNPLIGDRRYDEEENGAYLDSEAGENPMDSDDSV